MSTVLLVHTVMPSMITPLLEKHRAAGAQIAEFYGCDLPKRFSGLEKEYWAAKQNVALCDTNWQAILVLTGRDRLSYLHAISSQDIRALQKGQGGLALLLNPQGHILAELEVYALADKLLVLSHAGFRERTVGTLKKYVVGSQVHIDDQTDQMGSLALEGPQALRTLAETCGVALGEMPEMSAVESSIDGAPCYWLRRSRFNEPGAQLVVGRQILGAVWDKLVRAVRARGGEPIGLDALNALRLESGIPWFPADFNDGMIPQEAAIESTHVAFNKGCYTGQEIVERVRSRGHVNRKRVRLRFSTVTPPLPGTKLRANGTEVGSVTSAALSPVTGSAIGMGYVRREQFTPGNHLEFEGGMATVE